MLREGLLILPFAIALIRFFSSRRTGRAKSPSTSAKHQITSLIGLDDVLQVRGVSEGETFFKILLVILHGRPMRRLFLMASGPGSSPPSSNPSRCTAWT